jgi:mercuric ion transport protein
MSKNFWRKHIDKVGVIGSIFAALCCLGFPAVLSILGAIGLGFLINDAILVPLLALFLIVTIRGLYLGSRHHKRWLAFIIGTVSASVLFVSIVIAFNRPLSYLGVAGLIVASVLNVWLRANRNKIGPVCS